MKPCRHAFRHGHGPFGEAPIADALNRRGECLQPAGLREPPLPLASHSRAGLRKAQPSLDFVPGRFQSVDWRPGFCRGWLTTAHTDDALRNIIAVARRVS